MLPRGNKRFVLFIVYSLCLVLLCCPRKSLTKKNCSFIVTVQGYPCMTHPCRVAEVVVVGLYCTVNPKGSMEICRKSEIGGGGVEYGQKWQYIIVYSAPLLSREREGRITGNPWVFGVLRHVLSARGRPKQRIKPLWFCWPRSGRASLLFCFCLPHRSFVCLSAAP